MSKFIWEISDPAEGPTTGSPSGTVELNDVKVVSSGPWNIQNPDGSQLLRPQQGGEVDLSDHKDSPTRISRAVLNFAVVVGVIVFGFIMIHDAMRGNLTFAILITVIGPVLVGLDVASRKTK
jgi:hypothetical protein